MSTVDTAPDASRWQPFAAQDGDEVQALLAEDRAHFEQTYGYPPGAEAQSLLYAVPDGLSPDDKQVLVWRRAGNGPVDAVCDTIPDFPRQGCWQIGFFFVAVQCRKAGVGTAAARDLLDWLRRNGARLVRCSPTTDQAAARRLLETLGFAACETKRMRIGHKEQTLQVYTLALDPG